MSKLLLGQTIDFKKKSIPEISSYESSQNSTIVDTLKNFGILKNPHFDIQTLIQTTVLLYKRNNDTFYPQLHVWYHFTENLKEMKGIEYNWGLYNPRFNPRTQRKLLEELLTKENEFTAKFYSLQKELLETLGKPTKIKIIANNKDKFVKEIFWVDTEKIVSLSIHFSRRLEEIPVVGIVSDFHITVMVTYK
jgi:hypothetical protein